MTKSKIGRRKDILSLMKKNYRPATCYDQYKKDIQTPNGGNNN